jgi:hypothetical protein
MEGPNKVEHDHLQFAGDKDIKSIIKDGRI